MGAAAPRPAATAAGKMKMPDPMVMLTMLAVSERTPNARTSARSDEACMRRDCTSSLARRLRPSRVRRDRGASSPITERRLRKDVQKASQGRPSMAIASLKDLYFDELSDLYDAEMQMIRTLPRLAE